jgi:hypothetical protein
MLSRPIKNRSALCDLSTALPLAVTDFVLLRYRVRFLKIELNDRW